MKYPIQHTYNYYREIYDLFPPKVLIDKIEKLVCLFYDQKNYACDKRFLPQALKQGLIQKST